MPIPLEKLRKVTHVYTHANCPDGLASAMILRDAFRMLGTEPKIEFLVHGTKEHMMAGTLTQVVDHDAYVLFCDIAPHQNALGPVASILETGRVIVLDHHKGVEELVRSFGENGVFADEKLEPGVSGAVLAYREVWEPIYMATESVLTDDVARTKNFAKCIGARDTWQTKDPRFLRGQWISKYLMSQPRDWFLGGSHPDVEFKREDQAYLSEIEEGAGRVLFNAHKQAVRDAVKQCRRVDVQDVTLYVFQDNAAGFRLTSDVAEAIREQRDAGDRTFARAMVAGFCYLVLPGGELKVVFGLRGLGGFDVAAFAKSQGGGGHTAAAGFSVDVSNHQYTCSPYHVVERQLREFLTGGSSIP